MPDNLSKKNAQALKNKTRAAQYNVELLTGIRPTGSLTIANYLGAIAPIIKLQNQGVSPVVFIADLHAITDNEPSNIKQYIYEVVCDYIALGINPQKTKIYVQSDISEQITMLTALLARHISVAELLRIPILKDKLKKNARPETANALLLLYPIMMAADILLNKSKNVPIGEDQLAHMEITRLLARRFNKKYGQIFPIPRVLQIKPIRILSLRGKGKMSKSNPNGAIFLTDTIKTADKKIKSAETAFEGVISKKLESCILIAKGLSKTKSERDKVDVIIQEHKNGKPVMGQFKHILTGIVQNFLKQFQAKRAKIAKDPLYIRSILQKGANTARKNAIKTLNEVKNVLGLT